MTGPDSPTFWSDPTAAPPPTLPPPAQPPAASDPIPDPPGTTPNLPVPRPSAPDLPPAPAPAPEFSVGSAAVPTPALAQPAFAAPDPNYPGYAPPAYPTQGYPGEAYPTQPYPGQAYPNQPYAGQPYPGQAYAGQAYPGQVSSVTGPPAPAGYGGYGGYGVPPQVGYPVFAPQPKTNSLALASMITSIVGAALLVCYGIGGIPAMVGAILGHVARRQIRERGEGGDGMALAGIITGWIAFGLLLLGVIAIVGIAWWASTLPPTGSGSDSGTGGGFNMISLVLAAFA